MEHIVNCPDCNGTGVSYDGCEVFVDDTRCWTCGGKGKIVNKIMEEAV